MTQSEKFKAFLDGLERLSRETGVIIGGCGCCGSPGLCEMTAENSSAENGYLYLDGVEGEFVSWEKKPSG